MLKGASERNAGYSAKRLVVNGPLAALARSFFTCFSRRFVLKSSTIYPVKASKTFELKEKPIRLVYLLKMH
jgi:hypothetical protein